MMPALTVHQVKRARALVWRGHTVHQAAAKIGRPYGATWRAVRGATWSSIGSPPPIPTGHLATGRRPAGAAACTNCGREYDGYRQGNAGLCNRCYTYQHRHGQPRPAELGPYRVISPAEMKRLRARYQAGESFESLAAGAPFSAETIRRRFIDNGWHRRGNAGRRSQLTVEKVRWTRRMVHVEGWRVSDVAAQLGVHYQTMHSAVYWLTWQSAGGDRPADRERAAVPCSRCGLLTDHVSGLCHYCRGENGH